MKMETNTRLVTITNDHIVISTIIQTSIFDAPTEHTMILEKSDLRKIIDSLKKEENENGKE